jgi:hypothetical protein
MTPGGDPPEGGDTDDLNRFLSSVRRQQRRATDFSQADKDLRRFLAQREQKRRDSDHDMIPGRQVAIAFRE